MSVFIGEKNKRVELAERKDTTNPNLFTGSKDFTGDWINLSQVKQKDKYLDFTAVYVDGKWTSISQYIDVNAGETFTASAYIKAKAGSSHSWYTRLNGDTEDGHTRAETSPTAQSITATGDWQRCSITFTVTSDGTIKPQISSDGTVPFWIAGMKLEKGTVATDWCPALEDYAWTSDITSLQNTVNNKVNVDGPLYKYLTQFNNWSDLFDGYSVSGVNATNGNRLVAFRDDTSGVNTVGGNGAGIAFGGSDTKGVLSVQYNNHQAKIAGGNGTAPTWHEDIAWKSDITNLQNTIQAQQTANKTDVTNLQSMITGLQSQIKTQQTAVSNIQTGYMKKPTVISQADYDNLATKDPNTLYEITE